MKLTGESKFSGPFYADNDPDENPEGDDEASAVVSF